MRIDPAGGYCDATFGSGGHSKLILHQLGPEGWLFALDCDPAAERAAANLQGDSRFRFFHGRFSELGDHAGNYGFLGRLDGLLLDLGVSSPQLDDPARGFSFMKDAALDMRMDPTSGGSAADWIQATGEREIASVLRKYGEEPRAAAIARRIVQVRQQERIVSTGQLARLISAIVPARPGRHPATRSFQAIRIHINRELEQLQAVLQQSLQLLAARGRLVVISFHSLEDRLVKQFIRRESGREPLPAGLPLSEARRPAPRLRAVGPPRRPTAAELSSNRRSRSAVLRVAERLG